MSNATWTPERLLSLLEHEDDRLAAWALERLAEDFEEETELARGALSVLHREDLADRALELIETEVREEAEAGLRAFLDDAEPGEVRDRVRVLLALDDDDAANALADELITDTPEHAELIWDAWLDLAPEQVQGVLSTRYDAELVPEQPWLLVAWARVAPADSIDAVLRDFEILDVDDDEDMLDYFAEAVEAFLERMGAERLLEIDIGAEGFVDRIRSATKQGSWDLQDSLAKRLEDEDFPVGEWMAEDIAASPGLSPETDAIYAAFASALEDNTSDTAQVEVGAPAMVARARERALVGELEKQPAKACVVAWLVAGRQQRSALAQQLVELWTSGDAKERDKIIERLLEAARVGDLEHNSAIHELLTALELAEPPAGDAGSQIASAWLGFVEQRERNGLPRESPELSKLLADRPVLLEEIARERLERGTTPAVVLEALRGSTDDWVPRALIENAPALIATDAHERFWSVLAETGANPALEFALSMWRNGEPAIASAIQLLAALCDRPDAFDAEKARDIELIPDPDELDDEALVVPDHLWIKCHECGQTGYYDTPTIVYVPPQLRAQLLPPDITEKQPELLRWDGVFVNRPLRCKWCNELDNYWTTLQSQFTLQRYLSRAPRETTALPEQLDARRGVFIGRVQSQDGLIITRPSMLLKDVEELIEDDPENAESWRRVGYARANLGLFAEAREAYEKAAELEPDDMSSVVSLTALAMRQGDKDALRAAVASSLERVVNTREKSIPEEARKVELTGLLNALFALRDEPLALWVRWRQELEGKPAELGDAVVLSRIGDWNKVGTLFLDPNILELKLSEDLPPPGGHLERVLSAPANTRSSSSSSRSSKKGSRKKRKIRRKKKK